MTKTDCLRLLVAVVALIGLSSCIEDASEPDARRPAAAEKTTARTRPPRTPSIGNRDFRAYP